MEENTCVIGPVSICTNAIPQFSLPQMLVPGDLIGKLHPAGSNLLRMGVLLYNLFSEETIDFLACYNENCSSVGGPAPMVQTPRRLTNSR